MMQRFVLLLNQWNVTTIFCVVWYGKFSNMVGVSILWTHLISKYCFLILIVAYIGTIYAESVYPSQDSVNLAITLVASDRLQRSLSLYVSNAILLCCVHLACYLSWVLIFSSLWFSFGPDVWRLWANKVVCPWLWGNKIVGPSLWLNKAFLRRCHSFDPKTTFQNVFFFFWKIVKNIQLYKNNCKNKVFFFYIRWI